MSDSKNILVVCTGNICRSPMAEAFLRAELACVPSVSATVQSAGLHALRGQPASSFAQQAMIRYGLDISNHRGTQLGQVHVDSADIILVMTLQQEREMRVWYQGVDGKLHRITQLVGASDDIEDPYGGSLQEYLYTASVLARIARDGRDTLLSWLEERDATKKGTDRQSPQPL